MAQKVKPGLQKLKAGLKTGGTGGAAPAPAPAAAVGNTGGYYSPRQFGAQKDSYAARAEAARTAMEEQSKALRERQQAMEAAHRKAEEAQKQYHAKKGRFKGTNAADYEQELLNRYTTAVKGYTDSKGAYEESYAAYSPYELAYNRAAQEYSDYIRSEEEAYGQWKSTIRGAGDIRAEQKTVKKKRAELKQLMQLSNELSVRGQFSMLAANERRIQELKSYLGEVDEREKLLEEELRYSEHFRFEDLRQNPDFAQLSQYRSTGTAGQLQVDPMTGRTYDLGTGDRTYEYVNRNAQAVGAQAMDDVNNEMGHLQTMTDDEIAMYNYLYATQGPEGAAEYLGHLRQELTARQQEGYSQLIGDTIKAGGVPGAVLASAGSLLLSPISGIEAGLSQIGSWVTGKEIDPNAGYAMATNTKNAMRQSVSGMVEEKFGPAGGFLYNTGMSIADMLMDRWTGTSLAGESKAAMRIINAMIAGRGFSQTVIDGKKRGLSDEQALGEGTVAAAAELITEALGRKYGLDVLLRLPEGWESAGFWRGLFKGAVGEAGEEGLTNLINLYADLTIAGEDSQFHQNIRDKMEQKTLPDGSVKTGMSREEATKEAVFEALGDFGLDMLGGAISGGVFGGVDGWRGKKASDAQKNASEEAKAPEAPEGEALPTVEDPGGQMPPQSQSDSSPTQSAGEPVETAPVAGSAEDSSAAETVSAQAVQENVQKTPSRGTEPVRPGAGLEELKQQAMNRRNPLISGKLPTAQDEELLRGIKAAGTKTEVTAIDHGVSQERTQEALRIGEMIGRTVVFDPPGTSYNGFYHRPSGEIHISADTTDILAATVGHELTHSIEQTESWKELKRMVAKRMAETGTSWEAATRERMETYAAAGHTLEDQTAVDQEIVANYVEKHLLTDEESIRQLVQKDRSVARIILDWLDGLWAKIARTPKSKEREFVRRARETYRQAMEEEKVQHNRREAMAAARNAYANDEDQEGDAILEAAMADNPEGWLDTDWSDFDENELEFSYGGENARNADREALERAQRMEEQGFDKRQIFRDTGWFRGADGKWRFEIDDSKMKYHRAGDALFAKDHTEYRTYKELERKFIDGTITEQELTQMQELSGTWFREAGRLGQRVARGSATLANMLDHDALFEAYPQLREIKVRFGDTGDNADGWWDESRNEIVFSERLRHADSAYLEGVLLHEIQHAIQDMEGFARGSSPKYWEDIQNSDRAIRVNDRKIAKAEREAQEALRGLPQEVVRDFWYAANMMENDPEGAQKLDEELMEGEYADAYSDYSWAVWTLQELAEQGNPKRTAKDLYRNTAGEIEARDAAYRRGMDAGERKKQLPSTGDENTVFAEGSAIPFSTNIEEYPYDMQTVIREYLEAADDSIVEFVEEVKSGKAWKNKKISVGTVSSQMADDIMDIAGVKSSEGGNILLNVSAVEHILKRHGENGVADRSMKNNLDIARINYVLQNYDHAILGDSVSNTFRNRDNSPAKTVLLRKKINGTYFVVEVVPDTGKVAIVTAYINKKGTSQVPDADAPGRVVRNVLASVPNSSVTDMHDSVKQYSAENKNIRYSVREREEEGGFTRGWHDDDEAARAAQMEGYPVINGVQVVPMKTFVLAQDFRKDKAGNVILDKQGNPIQNHNYGLVAGLGSKPGTLKINFHNKHLVNEETGQTLRSDGVEIDIADLTPTPGVFQQTDEDFESLISQAPEEAGSHDYTAEELAELEELSRRAYMEEDAKGRKEWAPVERAALSGKAAEHLGRVERKLTANVAAAMDVPRQASRDFLKPIVTELADEYMKQGTISPEVRDRLFEKAWDQGRVVDQEFYDTYKEVKDHLRTTKVTLSESDRDSRDWEEFRKRAFGTLRIVNEGGTPVDVLWQELQEMAPALFPDDILNPEDQLKHMYEVGQSIRKVEKTLDEHYGSDAAFAKQMTRNDFDAAVADCIRGLWEVKRYADEQRTETAAVTDGEGEVLTVEEVTKLYPKLKDTRRAVEKAMAKNLLNKQDKNQVQRLLRHDIQPEHLDPEVDNVRGILAVYEAKKAFEEIAEPIRRWNKQRKARLYAEAEELVYAAEMAGGIQDKSKGIYYSRETMERNFRDIVKDRASADKLADTYIKPVHQGEAAATRMKNEYRDRVRALDISRKVRKGDQVSEAYAVQFYGEVSDILRLMEKSKFRLKRRDGKSYNEWQAELQKLWEENPSLDKAKIENAAREMGKIYEELFEKMNKVRVENGYEPINHRSGYFPHFQQDGRDGILAQFGKALGIDVEVQALPTSINGMTHTFKPGIRWFGNALERKTFDTAYDAVEGFDRYIEGCASVIHQTPNIQRLRALANQIRYRTGDEGLREQIRKIQEREDLTDEEKDALIRDKTKDGKFQLSNFVVELDEYTNLLANKKSRADRNMEQAMGRDMYNIVKGLESRAAANMVAINPASWLTNFIPITQGWAALDTRNLLKGMAQTIRAVITDDGMVDMSDFLTNRVGSDALVQTTAQKWAGTLSKPMEWIDGFTAGSLVRARYAQNIAQGMSEAEAMSEADEWTAGVMADRSKGAMPTVFHRSNPLTKVFTQFQLEVNNQLSYMFKDIPREKRKKGILAVALALWKLALGAWLYNELYEKYLGRRPALDPIDMAFGFVTDWKDPELDLADAAVNLGGKIAENTPFVGGLLGGGRVPISSALPDVGNLVKVVGDSDWSAGKKLAVAGKELAKPLTYMVLPFGGGQVKKIWEGLKMIRKDGSYTVDKDGRPLLQYPLYSTNDAVQKALEAGQAMAFGKTTIRSGRAWVEGGFKTLSADQTATYQALVNLGVEQADAFELMQELRGAEKTGKQSRAQVQRDILRSSGLEGDALGIVYYDLLVDDDSKEKALMEALQKDGADMGAVANCLMDMKDAADSNAKRDIIRTSGLTEEQKQDIYRDRISDSYDERIEKFREAGMDMDDFLIAQNEYTRIKDSYEDEGDMATAFARWVNNSGYIAAQKTVIRDSLKYWKQMPANADGYDRAIEAGLSDADAAELVEDLKAVTPLEGEDNKKQYQNWRVAIDNAVNEKNQLMLLKSVGMNDASYAKCEAAWGQGIAPAAYVRAKELESQFNEDGKGSLKNTEWTKLIDSMTTTGIVLAGDNTRFHLTNEQKGFLWQMLTGSKSTKNNPYSVRGGEKWLEIKETMEEE